MININKHFADKHTSIDDILNEILIELKKQNGEIKPPIQLPITKTNTHTDEKNKLLEEFQYLTQSSDLFYHKSVSISKTVEDMQTIDLTGDLNAHNEKGIITQIKLKSDYDNIIYKLKVDARQYTAIPKELAEWGLFGQFKDMFWISKYDDTTADYRIIYNSLIRYVEGIKLEVSAPVAYASPVKFDIQIDRLVRK